MQIKWFDCTDNDSVRRLGVALRRALRGMDPDGTVILDMRDFRPSDPEESVFELMVSLSCCSPHGPLPGRRIVLVVESDDLLRAIEWNLNKLRRANLAVTGGRFSILGSAASGTPGRIYEEISQTDPLTIAQVCERTDSSRRVVATGIDELLEWGLVMQVPGGAEPRMSGAGRPAAAFAATTDLIGTLVLREIEEHESRVSKDVATAC